MKRIVLSAFVTDSGQLRLPEAALVTAYRAFAGHRITLTMQLEEAQRTLPQNAYLHVEVFKKIAPEYGDNIPATKAACMGHHFGWMKDPTGGPDIPIKPNTSDMKKSEAIAFIDWIIPWALEMFGVEILTPDEWRKTPVGAKAYEQDDIKD